MLLEIAIGDAYGCGFEFAPQEKVNELNNVTRYEKHGLDSITPGRYTDDTQMSIAVAEVILKSTEWTRESFANSFVNVFNRDQRKGYAKSFYELLMTCDTGEDFLSKIIPTSTRNGAMMRSVPLGMIPYMDVMLQVAEIQAAITHSSEWGIKSSKIVAIASHLLMRDCPIKSLEPMINSLMGGVAPISYSWSGRVPCDAQSTISAVFTALTRNTSMTELLQECVSFGGDTDSVASVALGLASLTSDYINDLPAFLYDDLENGQYGRDYITKLDFQCIMASNF